MSDAFHAAIDRHFLAPDALRRATLLARHGWSAAEGWFKGEMIALVDSLAADGTIEAWRADAPISEDSKQRCDFRIVINGRPLWLEVKTIVDAAKQAADWGAIARGGGFTDDLVKLLRVPDGDRAVLAFILPRPSAEQWADLLSSYQRRAAPLVFEEQSSIGEYPEALYVCKLALKEMF